MEYNRNQSGRKYRCRVYILTRFGWGIKSKLCVQSYYLFPLSLAAPATRLIRFPAIRSDGKEIFEDFTFRLGGSTALFLAP